MADQSHYFQTITGKTQAHEPARTTWLHKPAVHLTRPKTAITHVGARSTLYFFLLHTEFYDTKAGFVDLGPFTKASPRDTILILLG